MVLMTTILTLNIRHGGGKRVDAICRFVESVAPDVAVLTEYRRSGIGARLREALATSGLEHQLAGEAGPRQNGVLLVSRGPLDACPLPARLAPFADRVVLARLPELTVLGVYLPPSHAKRPLFQALVDASPDLLAGPAVLLGDFNTGRHLLDEPGATFVTADLFVALEGRGWVDAWRHLHPQGRDSSWFSSKQNGFRIDHVFLSSAVLPRLRAAAYRHEPRHEGATDHAALVVQLAPAG